MMVIAQAVNVGVCQAMGFSQALLLDGGGYPMSGMMSR